MLSEKQRAVVEIEHFEAAAAVVAVAVAGAAVKPANFQ